MANVITSEQYKKWVKEYDSDDPLVVLMTITHPTLSEPVRISSDATKFIQLDSETQEPVYGIPAAYLLRPPVPLHFA